MTINNAKTLDVLTIGLASNHIIEASAGTGKTYNITKLFVRLLIEKQLKVQQILVMTFTKAATDELVARIHKEVEYALMHWGTFDSQDAFYYALQSKFGVDHVRPILNEALLHMDEASIFTIHSFCNRILSENAVLCGIDLNTKMDTDTSEFILRAIEDAYRALHNNSSSSHALLCQTYGTPSQFFDAFKSVISNDKSIDFASPDIIRAEIESGKNAALTELKANENVFRAALIDGHAKKAEREQELNALIDYLEDPAVTTMPAQAKAFLNGNRYRKQALKDAAQQLLSFNKLLPHMVEQLKQAESVEIASNLLNDAKINYQNLKQLQGVMGFDDLVLALSNALFSQNGQELTSIIRRKFPVALVDEFQDTDKNQFNILEQVYLNVDAAEHALFMIGDPKQAIYAFRGGDVFTYLAAKNKARFHWVMDANWRSSPELVGAYNNLFSFHQNTSGNDKEVLGQNIRYTPVLSKQSSTLLRDKKFSGALQFVDFPYSEAFGVRGSSEENSASFRKTIANWCASEISRLLSGEVLHHDGTGIDSKDIAVLVRSTSEAREIETALKAAKLPCVYLSDRENVFLSAHAKELYRFLNGVYHHQDNTLLMAAMSTRYFGLNAEQLFKLQQNNYQYERAVERVVRLARVWETKGLMAMLLAVIRDSYQPSQSTKERSITNSLHLAELLEEASIRYSQPRQLLGYFAEQINSAFGKSEAEQRLESEAGLIKIITQHSAKGLEYPVVFIPFATKDAISPMLKAQIHAPKDYHNDKGELRTFVGADKEANERYIDEVKAESVRLFYVAITRAISRCYVCTTPFSHVDLSPLGLTLSLQQDSDYLSQLETLSVAGDNHVSLSSEACLDFPCYQVNQIDNKKTTQAPTLFAGHIDESWRLSSYSSLSKEIGTHYVPRLESEQQRETTQPIQYSIAKGANTGNFLHEYLERSDFGTSGDEALLNALTTKYNHLLEEQQFDSFNDWMNTVVAHNVGNGFSLSQLAHTDVLKEVEFYFPVKSLDAVTISNLLSSCRGEEVSVKANQVRSYQGMMHGFIDLIVHWEGCFFVIDYKSNYLGNDVTQYSAEQIKLDMQSNNYDLQYLIYQVALHRFLKEKLPDYQPEKHLGGSICMYLRGMGDQVHGVYESAVNVELLEQFDSLVA